MKNRNGFVSNSSSSSFVIDKQYISAHQMEQIENHIEEGKKMGMYGALGEVDTYEIDKYDAWTIDDLGKVIRGFTIMDNFSMDEFLMKIGIPSDKIEWGDF